MTEFNTLRNNYRYFAGITTRWMDNDIYGHVNNVTYYSYFDSVANRYLIDNAGLDIQKAKVVGFVVASSCNYIAPVSYPEALEAGFRVNKLGNKSVEYGIGIFREGGNQAVAHGTFTHVFVDRDSGKSVDIPGSIRTALNAVLTKNTDVNTVINSGE